MANSDGWTKQPGAWLLMDLFTHKQGLGLVDAMPVNIHALMWRFCRFWFCGKVFVAGFLFW
jgi:hypothetical protein